MLKSWIRAVVLLVVTAGCWYVELVVKPSHFEMLLVLFTIFLSILSVCFLAVAIIRQVKPDASDYKIFAWADAFVGAGVAIYAIYDLFTDTGLLAGIVGFLLLVFVIPFVLLLLLIDFVLYRRNKKAKAPH